MISDENRAKVLSALAEGIASERKIAKATGLSKTTVHAVLSSTRARTRSVKTDGASAKTSPEKPEDHQDQGPPEDQPAEANFADDERELYAAQKGSPTTQGLTVDQKDAVIEMLQARVTALTQSMQSAISTAAKGSVAGESVAGRPSLAAYREETWRRLAGAVIDLPNTAKRLGRERTIELVSGTLAADLAMLMLGPPPTPMVAQMRVATEHFLSDRAKLSVMIGNDAAGRYMRTLFLKSCIKYLYVPSVQRLFDKSMETLLPSQMGFGPQE